MTTNFFKTLNSVLSHGLEDICNTANISQEEAIERCRRFLAENSAQYFSENGNPQLKYPDPFCRWAYLYTYVAAHANLIDNALTYLPELYQFVIDCVHSSSRISVCSLGGGPGSELLGFVKFIDRHHNVSDQVDIQFLLVDRISQWDDSWHSMIRGLEETFRDQYGPNRRYWPVQISRSFLPLNLLDPETFWGFSARFRDTDIFVLNHVVSELLGNPDELQRVLDLVVERAGDCSYFLFIDRNQQQVVDLTHQLISKSPDLYLQQHIDHRTNMDSDEEKKDLGSWYTLMKRDPKVRWNAFFTLARKLRF